LWLCKVEEGLCQFQESADFCLVLPISKHRVQPLRESCCWASTTRSNHHYSRMMTGLQRQRRWVLYGRAKRCFCSVFQCFTRRSEPQFWDRCTVTRSTIHKPQRQEVETHSKPQRCSKPRDQAVTSSVLLTITLLGWNMCAPAPNRHTPLAPTLPVSVADIRPLMLTWIFNITFGRHESKDGPKSLTDCDLGQFRPGSH
jgi:hypothetical protein